MRADTSRKRLRLCQFIAFCSKWYEWISRAECNCVADEENILHPQHNIIYFIHKIYNILHTQNIFQKLQKAEAKY